MRTNLIELRKKVGMTQRQFSKMGGIAFSTYCNIEAGRTPGNAKFWIEIGKWFNLTATEIQYLMEVTTDEIA